MSNREEIQITDLEPSIEGGDDVEYIVQIRGIDATGRPGPWSDELKFTSPQQIPSLQSFNYVPGEGGWRLDNDGTFEVNGGTIRGVLESFNYVPNVSGWRLSPGGFAEFGAGLFRGAIRIGTNTFNVEPTGDLWIGGTNFNNAPFAVNTNGQIQAMDIHGDFIRANTIAADRLVANSIGANQISTNYVYAGIIEAEQITAGFLSVDRLQVNTINGDRILNNSIGSGKIVSLSADKITAGTISANFTMSGSVSVTGSLSSTNANFFPNSGLWASGLSQLQLGSASIGFGTNVNAEVFPRIDRSGTALRLRGVGAIESAGTGGFFISEGLENSTAPANVFVNVQGRIFRGTSSSRALKKNIEYRVLPGVLDLNPAGYMPCDEDEGYDVPRPQYGLILEDVVDAGVVELLTYDVEGNPQGVSYDRIGVALIPHIKELYDRIEALERKIDGN